MWLKDIVDMVIKRNIWDFAQLYPISMAKLQPGLMIHHEMTTCSDSTEICFQWLGERKCHRHLLWLLCECLVSELDQEVWLEETRLVQYNCTQSLCNLTCVCFALKNTQRAALSPHQRINIFWWPPGSLTPLTFCQGKCRINWVNTMKWNHAQLR